MICFIYDVMFHATIDNEEFGTSEARIVDYGNGTWSLQFGDFANRTEVRATTEDIEKLINVLCEAMCKNDEEMAALSGDFENESKMDVLNTEAWLDKEG